MRRLATSSFISLRELTQFFPRSAFFRAIDMWSLGCILAELYTGFPIFPGENEQEQLSCIMEVLGLPDKYLIDKSSRKNLFFGESASPSSP